MELSPSSLISHLFISNLFSLSSTRAALPNLPTTRRSPSSIERCCRPTGECHESGDWLAMDEQDRETAGKRKTKNSSSLSKGEKSLAQAKNESERQAKKEQRLKEREEAVNVMS